MEYKLHALKSVSKIKQHALKSVSKIKQHALKGRVGLTCET
nr:hypothetical protein [Segatella copri]